MVTVMSFVVAAMLQVSPQLPGCPATSTRLAVDIKRSYVGWKGTKFFGLGSHEGTVPLRAGEVCVQGSRIVSATFIADMRAINVTDIPADDPIPRNRLTQHLLSEDFFAAARFPDAVLRITSVQLDHAPLHRVDGTLTIRDSTHRVSFFSRAWITTPAHARAEATLKIDRHQYGVRYRGSTIRDDLVDDDIALTFMLETQP